MNDIWTISIDDYLEIMKDAVDLGLSRGKKEGDNLEVEFFEVARRKGILDKINHVGKTDKDLDMLTGDLREEGIKILNLNEQQRKNKHE